MRNIYVIFCFLLGVLLVSCNNGNVTTDGISVSPTSLVIPNGESALVTVSLNFSGNVSESQTVNINGAGFDDVTAESIGGSCVLTNLNRSCQFVINVDQYAYESKYVLTVINSGNLPIVTGNSLTVKLPSWQFVGESNISTIGTFNANVNVALDSNNTPYVSYVDESVIDLYTVENSLHVKYFNSKQWVSLGGVIDSNIDSTSPVLEFFFNGYLNVIYSKDGQILRQIYANNTWLSNPQIVGLGGPTSYAIYDNSLYVASESNDTTQIKKFTNNSWQSLYTSTSPEQSPQIAIDSVGNLYMVYMDLTYNSIFCQEYINDQWSQIGSALSQNLHQHIGSLVISNEDVPYVSYVKTDGLLVTYFDGENWVGTCNDEDCSGFVDNGGDIKLLYNSYDHSIYTNYSSDALVVKKLIGNSWNFVGNNGIVGDSSYSGALVNASNGELFLAYFNKYDEMTSGFPSLKNYAN